MSYQAVFRILATLSIVYLSCSSNKKMKVFPISPYQQTVGFLENDTTIELTFAIKDFVYSKKNMAALDSFVKKRLPQEHLKDDHGILFLFYKYEKGKIDENFRHQEEPKQSNLFMEAGARKLIQYEWSHGKFISVSVFKDGEILYE